MIESCSCGAGIHSISYKRVLEWRHNHRHLPDDPGLELEQILAYNFIFPEEEK